MNDAEPVAWMVARDGEPCHLSWTIGDAKRELNRLELVSTGTPVLELFSLYRSPALTDAEREAVEFFADVHADDDPPHEYAVVLGKLLARLA